MAFVTLFLLEGVKYMALNLLSMARNNIMVSTLLGDYKLCRVSHVNTLCEILNGLQGLMDLNRNSGAPTASLSPLIAKWTPPFDFSLSKTFVTSILVERVLYVAWKLLPMARNNTMALLKSRGVNFQTFGHVNTFCEIFNDLHGLMALNGHSRAPDCTLIPSKSQMDPTIAFFRS